MKVLGTITMRTLPVNHEVYRAGEQGLSGNGAASPGKAGRPPSAGGWPSAPRLEFRSLNEGRLSTSRIHSLTL